MAKNITSIALPRPQAKNREVATLRFLRDISAAGIVFISLVPEASSRYIFVPVALAWILFALLSGSRAFHKAFIAPDIKSYSVYIWLLTYTIFYLTGYMHDAEIDRIFNLIRLGFSMLIFNYYMETGDVKAAKRIIAFALACIFVVCITTLRGLAIDPMAARFLATGREELIQGFTGMAIGSYGFIYGLVFMVVAVIGLTKTHLPKKQKITFFVLAALAIYTIFSAGFVSALLILALILVLLLLNIRKASQLLVVAFVLFMLALVFLPVFHSAFNYLGDIVEHDALSMRFHELAQVIRYGSVEGTVNFAGRWNFLTLSISTFLTNPILGVGGFYGFGTDVYGIGGHSAFFDELAKYGVLGSGFLFVALFSNARFVYRRLEHNKQKMVYYCSMSAFFILGAINTLLFVPVIFMAYFVVPGIIWCFSETHSAS